MSSNKQTSDGYKPSFDSHIFYPRDLLACKERSYLIGFNTTGFNCSICCAIPKDLFHNTFGLLEETLEGMTEFNDQYVDYTSTHPIVLGEWLPLPLHEGNAGGGGGGGGGGQELESGSRRFLLRSIWITLSGVGGGALLTTLHSCSQVYDTFSCQLVGFERCNTARVALLLNMEDLRQTNAARRCGVGGSSADSGDNSAVISVPDSKHRDGSPPDFGSVAADMAETGAPGSSASVKVGKRTMPVPPPINTAAPVETPLASTKASRLTLLQVAQAQQLLAHELEFCVNAALRAHTAALDTTERATTVSLRVSVLKVVATCCSHASALCCLPFETAGLWTVTAAWWQAMQVLRASSFVVCFLLARLEMCLRHHEARTAYNAGVTATTTDPRSGAGDMFARLRDRYEAWSFVTTIWLDVLLGMAVSWGIAVHYADILATTHYICHAAQSDLVLGTLEWLNQAPFGVKLNAVATRYISDLVAECFSKFAHFYLVSMNMGLGCIIRGVQMFGAIGFSGQLMLFVDALRLATLHLRLVACCMGLVTALATSLLTTLSLFFRGKKRNPLRGCRVDSAPLQDWEHLLIGTIVFASTVFITPTFITFYAFFGLLQLGVQALVTGLWHVATVLLHCPWFLLYCRLRNPASVVNGRNLMFQAGGGRGRSAWGQVNMHYRNMAYRDIMQLLWGYLYTVYYYAFAAVSEYASRPASVRGWIACYGGPLLYILVGADYQLLTSMGVYAGMCVTDGHGAGGAGSDSNVGSGHSTPVVGSRTAKPAAASSSRNTEASPRAPLRALTSNERLRSEWAREVDEQVSRQQRQHLQQTFVRSFTQFLYISCVFCAALFYIFVYCKNGSGTY